MATSLDVLFCTDYLPPSDGGVEHVVDQLVRRLASRGYDVGVFTLEDPDDSIALDDHPNVTVFTAGMIDLTGYVGLQSAVSMDAIPKFRRVLSETDPSIVHVHNRFFFTSFLGLLYRSRYGYALVTTLHLGELDHLDGMGSLAGRLFQRALSTQLVARSDFIICVSDSVKAVAYDLGAESSRTAVIRNSVDLDRFETARSDFDKTLLYVGRLVRNNGPQDLMRAAPAIVAAHPDVTIHFVGSGTLRSTLEQQAADLGVDDAVQIHGFVDDIVGMYADADVFCRPSYSEGLPLTLLESMATYTVPVVTPVAGSSEVVTPGTTGRFVGVDDPGSISETINDLFDRPDSVVEMSESARAYIEENLSWDARTEKILSVYQQVLEYDEA